MKARPYLVDHIDDPYRLGELVQDEMMKVATFHAPQESDVTVDVFRGGYGYVVKVDVDGSLYFWTAETLVGTLATAISSMPQEAPL